jgi:hypothetical protein
MKRQGLDEEFEGRVVVRIDHCGEGVMKVNAVDVTRAHTWSRKMHPSEVDESMTD